MIGGEYLVNPIQDAPSHAGHKEEEEKDPFHLQISVIWSFTFSSKEWTHHLQFNRPIRSRPSPSFSTLRNNSIGYLH